MAAQAPAASAVDVRLEDILAARARIADGARGLRHDARLGDGGALFVDHHARDGQGGQESHDQSVLDAVLHDHDAQRL